MSKHTIEELYQYQSLPLSVKVQMTKHRIRDWINEYGEDKVYVSFSGGKDSTVLLDIVRQEYPNVVAVFSDTGLEFPEIKEFVKTFPNVEIIKPKMTFRQVIDKYGFPMMSKEVSNTIFYARRHIEKVYEQHEVAEIRKKVAEIGNTKEPTKDQILEVWDAVDNFRIQKLLGLLPTKGMLTKDSIEKLGGGRRNLCLTAENMRLW